MATSGTINKAITSWLTLRLKWVANSQNVANNTTNLTVTAQLVTSGGKVSSSASKDISLTINGTKYSSTCTIGISQNTTKTLFTKTVNVAHNADGSKTCAIACALELNVTLSGKTYDDASVSGNATLNTIPRASTFTRSGTATMGNAQTITITRASSSFTHKLYYTWGGTKTLIASSVGTSHTWTPPVSMAEKIPNATSGSCTLTCETYNGSTLIGTKTLSFTLSVPASVVPTISAFTLAEAVSGLAAQFGGFVDTKSKIKYTVTAAGAQGSTIKSYSVSLANQKFTSNTGTTAVVSVGAGTKTATVTVTDSRGRTATKSVTFTVYAYTPPTFKGISAKRCNADGTESDEGTCLKFYVSIAIAAVNNKNTATYSLGYKLSDASSYTALPLEASGYTYSETTVFESPAFSIENVYDIKFTATDYFATVTSVVELPTAKPMIDYKANHKGIGIGKVAQVDNMLDVGYTTRFYGGITAMQIDSGADLNNYLTPNIYVSSVSAGDGTKANYTNCPIVSASTFSLEVAETGIAGQRKQTFTVCSKVEARVFERFYYNSSWSEWVCTYAARNAVLWAGESHMNAEHYCDLTEKISAQPTGIVLVFAPYTGDGVQNHNFITYFVSKYEVLTHSGSGHTFPLFRTNFIDVATKYLYINDQKITGNANNVSTGTNNGITFNNSKWALRYVIGV